MYSGCIEDALRYTERKTGQLSETETANYAAQPEPLGGVRDPETAWEVFAPLRLKVADRRISLVGSGFGGVVPRLALELSAGARCDARLRLVGAR